MIPMDLLKRMADVYAGAKTYADRGRTRYRRVTGSSWSEEQQAFATFLDRQRGFRFEMVQPSSTKPVILWSGQEPGRSLHPNRTQINLLVELFKLYYCFGPAARTSIPSLLLPGEFGGSFLKDFQNPQYQGEEVIGSRRCHRIFGHWQDRTEVLLWLDEDRFLVRQLQDRTEYPHAREAAKLREAHLRRRDHALAAGIPRGLVEQVFGADHILAIKHWPYAVPREDSQTITKVTYEPHVGVPIDERLFKRAIRA